MNKYQEALDRILSYAYMYLAYRTDATQKELESYVRGILQDKRMIEKLINEKIEFESRKEKLVVGSEWECVVECLAERYTENVSYTRIMRLSDSFIVTKIGYSYIVVRLPQIDFLAEYTMPTDQFLLCFKHL